MNLDQARAVAEEYFNGVRPAEEAVAVGIHGFAHGFVAWAREPEPGDPSVLPQVAGGGCIVIDGGTGEVAIRPLLDPETVAAHWPGRSLR
ncbi:hypothetical protein OIE66_32125 [Nonomuraea sp. NBC_01738]|uniref:hypothetical protein n=1 Tax=Nonomuraea sp. NBC_01738 TaxID=2976003 RepID=UPI002E0F7FA6|nr:hypothetical protein OIE66_32125 [Nonomuraea sp. NBC_01738]